MDPAARKEAIKQYKERKPCRGAFAVRCTASGRIWVGASPNLDASRNSFLFALRHGSHYDRGLQEELQAHGELAFAFEVLEELKEDILPMEVSGLLKETKLRWAERLGARTLL